jgi:hypothetical protein
MTLKDRFLAAVQKAFSSGRPRDAARFIDDALGPRRHRKRYRGASRREAVRGVSFRYRVTDEPRDVGRGDKMIRAHRRAARKWKGRAFDVVEVAK